MGEPRRPNHNECRIANGEFRRATSRPDWARDHFAIGNSRFDITGWAWIAAALVVYGSLIPFDFHWPDLHARWGTFLRALDLRSASADDCAVNIILYVPLGFLFAIRRRRSASWWTVTSCILLCGLISGTDEMLQMFLPARVPSALDVILNFIGAAMGACSARVLMPFFRRATSAVAAHANCNPPQTLASVLTCAILFQVAVPLDFLTTTTGLHHAFQREVLLPSLQSSLIIESSATVAGMISHLAPVGWFLLLGFVVARGEEDLKHPGRVIATVAWRAAILVVLMEFLGLFRASHVFDAGLVVLRVIAAYFGAWCAVFVWNPRPDLRMVRRSRSVPSGWLLACACVLLVNLGADRLANGHVPAPETSIASTRMTATFKTAIAIPIAMPIVAWPFEALWRSSTTTCASTLMSAAMNYATLSVLTFSLLARLGIRRSSIGSIVLNVAVAGAMSVHISGGVPTVDLTVPIFAGLTAALIVQSFSIESHGLRVNAE